MLMWYVEVRVNLNEKERWEGLTEAQAEALYKKYSGRKAGAWYVRKGLM